MPNPADSIDESHADTSEYSGEIAGSMQQIQASSAPVDRVATKDPSAALREDSGAEPCVNQFWDRSLGADCLLQHLNQPRWMRPHGQVCCPASGDLLQIFWQLNH
jgi:hypothetical protein